MEMKTFIRLLGHLPEDASDRDVAERIEALREAAGEEDTATFSNRELLTRGEHENVTIDSEGAHVSLYFPIHSGSETIATLRLRRPTTKEMRKFDENDSKKHVFSRCFDLVCDLSGRAPAELEKLDAADLQLLVDVALFLRRPPRRTGSRS